MKATVFAPATVANVIVGFDILGFSLKEPGDEVTLRWIKSEQKAVIKILKCSDSDLPVENEKNTASVAVLSMIKDLELKGIFEIEIKKGIPVSSGMGGSAASAVGAVLALNSLLENPLEKQKLLTYALEGEKISSGSYHLDNVLPCMMGGLNLVLSNEELTFHTLPSPKNFYNLLFYPELKINTKDSRAMLKKMLPVEDFVQQSSYLSAFISSCYCDDREMMRWALKDCIVEPQREGLVPHYRDLKSLALDSGAIGCGFSGSGPSLFSWFEDSESAEKCGKSMIKMFKSFGIKSKTWVHSFSNQGAYIKQ